MAEAKSTESLTKLILDKGGEIELVEDTVYTISSNMVSRRSCDIIGPKDRSAVLKIGNRVRWAEQVPMMRFNSVNGLTFENVSFDGNFANCGKVRGKGYQTFVRAVNGSDILFKNCNFHDNAGDGIRLDTCTDVVMTGCDAERCGHELVYAIYGCSDMQFYDNNVLNYCNSGFRLDSSAYDVDIFKNTIHSLIVGASTGPAIEIAKGVYEGICIDYNTIYDENGSGIWISGDRAACKDCQITHNTFKNVGNFLNGSGKYNGYSNGGISGAGLDGLLIEENTFEDINVGYAILMAEAKHEVKGKYAWNFKNNTLKNCKYGFRVSSARGSVSGGGNTFTNVRSLKYGLTGNITVTEKEETKEETVVTTPTETPIENTEETTMAKQMKYTLNVVDPDGNAIKVNSAADVQVATKQDGNSITGYVVFTTPSGDTTGRIPINAPLKKQ